MTRAELLEITSKLEEEIAKYHYFIFIKIIDSLYFIFLKIFFKEWQLLKI